MRFRLFLVPLVAFLVISIGVVTPTSGASDCVPRTLSSLGPPPKVLETGHYQDGTVYTDPSTSDSTSGSSNSWDWWTGDSTAQATSATTRPSSQVVYCDTYWDMTYPIVGESRITSVFGDVREDGWRWHAGVDFVADKWTPIVAAADGEISRMNNNPYDVDCCWVVVGHEAGWETLYAHLTNDTPGTDDGSLAGIRPDLRVGSKVKAGEVVGWVGDSGNAEDSVPHLHFELRMPGREPVDPLPSIKAASPHPIANELPDSFVGPFVDDDQLGDVPYVSMLLAGSAPWNDEWGLHVGHEELATLEDVRLWIEYASIEPFAPRWMRKPGRSAPCVNDSCEQPVRLASALTLLMAAFDRGVSVDPIQTHSRYQQMYEGCFPYSSPNDLLTRAQLDRLVDRIEEPVKIPICSDFN